MYKLSKEDMVKGDRVDNFRIAYKIMFGDYPTARTVQFTDDWYKTRVIFMALYSTLEEDS